MSSNIVQQTEQPSVNKRQRSRVIKTTTSHSQRRQDGFFVKQDLNEYTPSKMIDTMNTSAQLSSQNVLVDIISLCKESSD